MITRYVPLGLLCILLFLCCKTIVIEESDESRSELVEVEEISVEKTIDELVRLYINEPKILIKKIYEEIEPDNLDYNLLIGRLYFSIGDYFNSQKVLNQIHEGQQSVEILELLTLCAMGLNVEYVTFLDKMLELDPGNNFALNRSAIIAIEQLELNRAEELLMDSYYSDKTNKQTKILMGDLELARVDKMNLASKKVLNSKEEIIVTEHYKKSLRYYLDSKDTNNPNYYVKLSIVYKNLGRKLDAIKALDEAILLDPDNLWNYYDRGKLYFYKLANDKALEDFLFVYSVDPNNFFTNVFLGRIYFSLNDIKSSLFYNKRVMSLKPEYTPAYKDISILYYSTGDTDKSLYYIEKLYSSKKDRDPFLPLYFVNSLIETGKNKDAKYILENLVKYEKNSTMKGIYNYYLNPSRTGDQVLNNVLTIKDEYQRSRLSFYISCALERDGITSLSKTLFKDVAESGVEFESKLAMYKLGEFNE